MNIIFLIIPISLILVGLAVWAFVWAVNHEQFEDLDRAASSILFDDDVESAEPPSGVAPDDSTRDGSQSKSESAEA